MPVADEQRLIRLAQEGDRDAYSRLVERHMKQAYNVAFGFVHNHEDARDVLQEALVKAFTGLPAFRGDSHFATWLQRIVMNLSLNHVRASSSRHRREVPAADVPVPGENHDGALHSQQIREHLERAIHDLPTLQRAVVILRHVEGLSTRQVSVILGCSEGTVKTHLFRGLKKLRQTVGYLQEEAV